MSKRTRIRGGAMFAEGTFPATAMPDSDWWRALWPAPERVLADLGIEPGLDIVDLCCGDGHFTAAIAQQGSRVAALDIDPRMLQLARAKVAPAAAGHCTFIEGDACDLAALVPWPADLVFMANTLHGVPDKQRLARAVAAILKPSGRFVVINWHRRPREETQVLGKPRGPMTEMRMESKDVAAALEPCALRIERIIDLPPYHYGAILKKDAAQ
ncbi:MAG: class I SAM-dependent methyltransferase [Steroidobacteraceae bacterium]